MHDVTLLAGREGRADGKVSGKCTGLAQARQLRLDFLSGRAVCEVRGVAVKCIDNTQNCDCEGSTPAPT